MSTTSTPTHHGTIQLSTKPNANLSYTFLPGAPTTDTLVVFLNGLILPKASWEPTISAIHTKLQNSEMSQPHLLAYDRYGQGTSSKDPHGDHDILDSVQDLYIFLVESCEKELRTDTSVEENTVVFVCNSIGCAVARLFAEKHPTIASGFVFLDSIMAHVDLVALWPDVDAPGFKEENLPNGTTRGELRNVKEEYRKRFHVSAPNPEGLDRSSLAALLPEAGAPKLKGDPQLTVVGHDDEVFAQENEYVNPIWREYNKELATLTLSERSKGPVVARGCGHFIQRDDPEFVAMEVCDMLQRLAEGQ
ncbi:unnamed protein product, partial [Aureobasidium mustum]